jgi:putative hydrolase of the HAD superfamily
VTRAGPAADAADAGLTLLFDGDDTLWPNSHIFETAIERFVRLVGGGAWTDEAVRDELDRVEEAAWSVRGGGTNAFRHNLEETARAIVEPDRLPDVVDALDAIVREMAIAEAEPLPGVEATLDVLGARHVLGLVTRGDPAEQWAKIDASGLRGRFRHIDVVRDKDEASYRRLVAAWALDASRTWMIGNSPRSDIAPARAAGLGAVHIPSASTWRLELADLDPDDARIVRLESFADLARLF